MGDKARSCREIIQSVEDNAYNCLHIKARKWELGHRTKRNFFWKRKIFFRIQFNLNWDQNLKCFKWQCNCKTEKLYGCHGCLQMPWYAFLSLYLILTLNLSPLLPYQLFFFRSLCHCLTSKTGKARQPWDNKPHSSAFQFNILHVKKKTGKEYCNT